MESNDVDDDVHTRFSGIRGFAIAWQLRPSGPGHDPRMGQSEHRPVPRQLVQGNFVRSQRRGVERRSHDASIRCSNRYSSHLLFLESIYFYVKSDLVSKLI